jgi:hypothetical protein
MVVLPELRSGPERSIAPAAPVPGESERIAIWNRDIVPDAVAISSALRVREVQKRG